ncbi:hypothetical protein N474_07120 [Pseudoalteromonas luteoviolacea CPMOR-2]|uniref:Uncharacterized protein n=1 Tax=Pseudoalteromonas luteoviolacea DSM 6061 TaxID=1365250 RepID=A0A166WE56_9GAMM|nr:hypothetical protein [Pseudoalteromonas luteoviolacea]KZN37291.1 hypothetical protein N475_16480 [Pseudoalteromonas luteoviolacea DSM 6061]KZN59457.1 hypothetical protein N474_07120 [Pseudoalteromonas luteoviolacea CPMOR-2]MBE0387486.1 hypothetical protein [Pseudoalteromonas luteoviolacea DSM 6061]
MIQAALVTFKDTTNKLSAPFERFWHSLNTPQRLYFSALFISIAVILFTNDDNHSWFHLVAVLALVAMLLEFWPKFLVFWESLPGKAVILLFYAFIANYALVQAAGMINDITGVSSDPLPYSHNLSVLLSLPTWFFITTIVLLVLLQLAQPLYLLVLVLLRPFGLHRMWQPTDYKYPVTTGILRLVFSMLILVQVATLISHTGLSGGVNQFLKGWFEIIVRPSDFEKYLSNEQSKPDGTKLTEAEQAELQQALDDREKELNKLKAEISVTSDNTAQYEAQLQRILRHFIYEYEADSRSRCEHAQGTRIIELNDYEILQITKLNDDNSESSYLYEVVPCISAALGHQFKPAN